jgi:hypothetical protein
MIDYDILILVVVIIFIIGFALTAIGSSHEYYNEEDEDI